MQLKNNTCWKVKFVSLWTDAYPHLSPDALNKLKSLLRAQITARKYIDNWTALESTAKHQKSSN